MSSSSRTFQGTFGMKWRQFLTRWGARIARFRDMGGRNLALKHCCHSSCRYSIGRAKERGGYYARPGAVKNPFLPEFAATHRKSPVLVRCPDNRLWNASHMREVENKHALCSYLCSYHDRACGTMLRFSSSLPQRPRAGRSRYRGSFWVWGERKAH